MQINTIANPLTTGISATGRVKTYQAWVGSCQLLILPLSYICLLLGWIPESVYYVHLVIAVITQILRVVIVLPNLKLSIKQYLFNVVFPILLVSLIVAGGSFVVYRFFPIQNAFVMCPIYVIIVMITVYLIGLNANERRLFNNFILSKLSSINVRINNK